MPAGPVREVHEVMHDPALRERQLVRDVSLPDGTSTPLMSLPWRIDGERPGVMLPPPALGEATEEFLARFGA